MNRKAQVDSRAAAQEVIRNMRQLLSAVLLLAATLAVGCSAQETGVSGGDTQEPEEVQLRILAINDFHGNIATTSDVFGDVGRADYLAANDRWLPGSGLKTQCLFPQATSSEGRP